MTNEEFQAEHPNVTGAHSWRSLGMIMPSMQHMLRYLAATGGRNWDQVLLHHYPSGKVACYFKEKTE